MIYHYTAVDKNGKVSEGECEGADVGQALAYLSRYNLKPLTVVPMTRSASAGGIFGGGRIDISDKIFITRYLSLMLKVGTDLLSAVNILIADFEKPAIKNFLIEVRENITKGQPFYQVFSRYPKYFNTVFVNLVRAAEASGNLQQTFQDLSTSLEKEDDLRKKIRAAMVYPIILLVASVGIFSFLSLFALPKIAKIFGDTGVNPPTFSRIVFAIGLFLGDHITVILSLSISLFAAALFFFTKTLTGRRAADRLMSKTPVLRNVYRDMAVQRFAATFSSLLRSGLPIIEAIKITADVVGSETFRVSLIRVADEGLAKGLTVGEAFRREKAFPRVVVNLIAISEKAGHLEEVLQTVSDFYTSNVNNSVQMLISVLEPVLLLFMGGLVGGIAMAIIVPIYQLTNQF